MLDCIVEIHRLKRVHRDIKPDNFMVDKGKVHITDFGTILKI
jgi:serine/threonine protein kinase